MVRRIDPAKHPRDPDAAEPAMTPAALDQFRNQMAEHGWHSFARKDRSEDDEKFLRWCRELPADWAVRDDDFAGPTEDSERHTEWEFAIRAARGGDDGWARRLMGMPDSISDIVSVSFTYRGKPRTGQREPAKHLQRFWMAREGREYQRRLARQEAKHYGKIEKSDAVLRLDALLIVVARWGEWSEPDENGERQWRPTVGYEDLDKVMRRKHSRFEAWLEQFPHLAPDMSPG